jgi:hypothetical protein
MTSCLTGLDQSVLQIKTKIVSCHTADSKPAKQEVNGTGILPHLVFPGLTDKMDRRSNRQSMVIWSDGPTDGLTNGRMDGRTDGKTDGRTNGRTDGWRRI